MKTLMVGDFSDILRTMQDSLQQLGHTIVEEAEGGQRALARLRQEAFDCIVADWNMAGMSGLELLQALRSDPVMASLPFLMATTQVHKENINAAAQAGASGYIVKPFTAQALDEKIQKIIENRNSPELAAPPEWATPSKLDASSELSSSADMASPSVDSVPGDPRIGQIKADVQEIKRMLDLAFPQIGRNCYALYQAMGLDNSTPAATERCNSLQPLFDEIVVGLQMHDLTSQLLISVAKQISALPGAQEAPLANSSSVQSVETGTVELF